MVNAARSTWAATSVVATLVAPRLDWKLSDDSDSTRLELSYSVGGFIQGGFEKIAPAVEAMLREQFERLKLFVETGKPTKQ